jgi:branched-chain amino acid transport system substrate-binding protein
MQLRAALAALCLAVTPAAAEISDGIVRIGVLNDVSGVFQDTNGMGSVEAARMAAEDFAGGTKGIRVEIVFADHQNKPDVGSVIARRWLDVDKVDAIVDVPNSAVGLAVNAVLRDTRMTFLASTAATSELTGRQCSPNTIQWVHDTWAIGHTTARAVMKAGGDSWYFVTVNYALGHGIETEASKAVAAQGGRVLGASRHPLGTADFSSILLQAQASKAKVIGIANAGADTTNVVKQAVEFGLTERASLVAFVALINDVHALGLASSKGLRLAEAFYWDLNDDTRAFARRFYGRPGMNKMPSANQAGVYSATLAYLRAVAALGTDEAKPVVAQMKRVGKQDELFGDLSIREDGRVIHPIHLFEVKRPEDSKGPWDYYKLIDTVPAAEAFRPMGEGGCPLVK